MSSQILSNAKLWLDGYDLSGDVNALAIRYGAEIKDATPVSAVSRVRLPGLRAFGFAHEGFWNGGVGNVDDALFQRLGLANTVMSVSASALFGGAGAEGEIADTGQVVEAAYSPGAKIGDVLAFSVAGEAGAGPLVRGTVCLNGTKTVTGSGSVFQLGAVSAAQKLYAALHVLAPVAGVTPTLNVKVQSAALVGFGSPTDRITFAQAVALGAQWGAPAAGAITDQFYRVTWTIGGTGSPSFPFVVVVGIL
jgi:hypothetical protein